MTSCLYKYKLASSEILCIILITAWHLPIWIFSSNWVVVIENISLSSLASIIFFSLTRFIINSLYSSVSNPSIISWFAVWVLIVQVRSESNMVFLSQIVSCNNLLLKKLKLKLFFLFRLIQFLKMFSLLGILSKWTLVKSTLFKEKQLLNILLALLTEDKSLLNKFT